MVPACTNGLRMMAFDNGSRRYSLARDIFRDISGGSEECLTVDNRHNRDNRDNTDSPGDGLGNSPVLLIIRGGKKE